MILVLRQDQHAATEFAPDMQDTPGLLPGQLPAWDFRIVGQRLSGQPGEAQPLPQVRFVLGAP